MGLNEILTADSEARTVEHSDGTNAYQAKRLDVSRLEWLPLLAGVTNQLKFIDPGTQAVTVTVRFAPVPPNTMAEIGTSMYATLFLVEGNLAGIKS